MLLFDSKVSGIKIIILVYHCHAKGKTITNLESRDSTCFTPRILCSISFQQDNSMMAPGFSMSLISRKDSIIITLSGKYLSRKNEIRSETRRKELI